MNQSEEKSKEEMKATVTVSETPSGCIGALLGLAFLGIAIYGAGVAFGWW